jgi:energy-coupling factor transporter ATP-binding protein EcfA2
LGTEKCISGEPYSALADFLAEASLRPPAPVIFGNPINSLDYKRMAEVVERIVESSETRKVIVFTHNILTRWSFMNPALVKISRSGPINHTAQFGSI